jgi:energy-coupling factor transporter transmembrane protein EcfT
LPNRKYADVPEEVADVAISERDNQEWRGVFSSPLAMKTLQLALAPGAIAGVLAIFTSWLWMGVVFHRYQKLTPNTWRPENNRSYALSSAITFLSCIAIATLFLLVARMGGVFEAEESARCDLQQWRGWH